MSWKSSFIQAFHSQSELIPFGRRVGGMLNIYLWSEILICYFDFITLFPVKIM